MIMVGYTTNRHLGRFYPVGNPHRIDVHETLFRKRVIVHLVRGHGEKKPGTRIEYPNREAFEADWHNLSNDERF